MANAPKRSRRSTQDTPYPPAKPERVQAIEDSVIATRGYVYKKSVETATPDTINPQSPGDAPRSSPRQTRQRRIDSRRFLVISSKT